MKNCAEAKVLKMDNDFSCSETTDYETTPTVWPFCVTGKVLKPYF
jgi:hypothetical protein